MAKSKKRSAKKKTQASAIQKSSNPKKNTAQKNKSSITQFLFGHSKINKKDLIEISIMIILVAFLIFMDLKMKEII